MTMNAANVTLISILKMSGPPKPKLFLLKCCRLKVSMCPWDTISIMDKDFEVNGRISDIGLFFVKLKTKQGEEVSLPNNIFLQKMIKKKIA